MFRARPLLRKLNAGLVVSASRAHSHQSSRGSQASPLWWGFAAVSTSAVVALTQNTLSCSWLASADPVKAHVATLPQTVQYAELRTMLETLPVEKAVLTLAPNVPPPLTRTHPVRLVVEMYSTLEVRAISPEHKYPFWTYNGGSPGPFIRARVGDLMEVHYTNRDSSGVGHNIDFHAVSGPGGGASALYAEQNETKTALFKLTQPGLYIYHCAAGPVPQHIQNGMYGLILVEPEEGLSKVDKEFYVVQSEWYAEENADDKRLLDPSFAEGLVEHPYYVTFNGRVGALTEKPLLVKSGERAAGNAGPNLVSSFHIIGIIFDKVYREGDLISPPARGIQTTLVAAGGATVVEWTALVPGNNTIVDHSIFRTEKGAIGFVKTSGDPCPHVYLPVHGATPCPNCKMHN